MLTKHQIDRLAAFEGFLMELLDSPEFKEIEASDDFHPDLNLADALQAIRHLRKIPKSLYDWRSLL
jgi:hypothetical protein